MMRWYAGVYCCYGPNEYDDPFMDQELRVGDIVYFVDPYTDEFDHPARGPKVPLTIVRVGSSSLSFDYEVASPDGDHFFVRLDEIEIA